MSVLARLAGIAVSTAIGVALAGCTTAGITPVPEQAQATPTDQCATDAPKCDPNAPSAQDKGKPACGFSVENGIVYVQAFKRGQVWLHRGSSTKANTFAVKRGDRIDLVTKRKDTAFDWDVFIIRGHKAIPCEEA